MDTQPRRLSRGHTCPEQVACPVMSPYFDTLLHITATDQEAAVGWLPTAPSL